jgi:Domain of unknown function (DUF4468) with TBP-like fold
MKKLFTITFLILSFKAFAQISPMPLNADSLIEYQKVVHLKDTLTKKELIYDLSKKWLESNYKKPLFLTDDAPNHLIAVLKDIKIQGSSLPVKFTIEIFIKDGKYKYRIYNIEDQDLAVATGINFKYVDDRKVPNPDPDDITRSYMKYIHGQIKAECCYISKKKNIESTEYFLSTIDELIKTSMADLENSLNKTVKASDDF